MNKRFIIFSGLILSSIFLTSYADCRHCLLDDKNTSEKVVSPNIGGTKTGVIGPRWTYGIMIKNASDKDIRVRVDGGDVNGYVLVLAGKEKLLNSRGDDKRGVYWKSGDFEYETEKYAKPDYIIIKNGNLYTMTSMDGTRDMGGWTAIEPVDYPDQKAKIKKIK